MLMFSVMCVIQTLNTESEADGNAIINQNLDKNWNFALIMALDEWSPKL